MVKLLDKADQVFSKSDEKYQFHIHPKKGWANDPNGLVYFKERYHVFFQCNPFENNNRQIFWAHVSSADLIQWRWEPFALAPDKEYDQEGCFSGSGIVEKEQLYLFYTGHKVLKNNYSETVCVAVSHDGRHFNKLDKNPLIHELPKNNSFRFRDPKIWKDDVFHLVIGGENKDEQGQINLYESEKILGPWEYKGILAKSRGHEGNMWECPDFFELNTQQILLTSPKGLETNYKHGFESVYLTQDFENPSKVGRRIEAVDHGIDFYAPQTFFDPIKKRRILFGWAGLPGEQEKEEDQPQSGALTIPREITWQRNKLYMTPIEEMVSLRNKEEVQKITRRQTISNYCELVLEGSTDFFVLHLQSTKAKFKISYEEKIFSFESTDPLRDRKMKLAISNIDEIRLFIDHDLTELFINHGEYVWTNKCKFDEEIYVEKIGNKDLKCFPIKSIFLS